LFPRLCRTISRADLAKGRRRRHGQSAIAQSRRRPGAIERAGASLRYLPPYSLDFNPIEQAFAKLKASLRKAAARTFEALIKAIAQALAEFKPQECANYIAKSGYRHPP
jgi:transposase